MATAIPSPSLHPARIDDGTLFYVLWDAVAVWGWEWVLAELAEVARVRGDGDMAKVMMVASSGLAESSDIDIDELVTQEPRAGTH